MADAVAKLPTKPTTEELTQIIEESRGTSPGFKVTVEADAAPAGPVLDGPAVPSGMESETSSTQDGQASPAQAGGKALTLRKSNHPVRPLSKQELDDFENYEAAVDEGLPKFLAVGEALYLIRQRKLYRTQYSTFAEYCEKRFGLSRQNAYLQIAAAEVTENLSSNGLQIPAGTTERVLRPLANQTPEVQLDAWKLAQARAKTAGRKMSGKDVEAALKEVLGGVAQQRNAENWYTTTYSRFTAAGYKTDFEQPVSLGEDEWIDFLAEEEETYVKIIDQPTLSNLGICVALREGGLKYQVIVNGNNLRKTSLMLAKDGTLTHLLNPGVSYFIHLLGAYIERDGKLYEPDLFGQGYKLKLKRASSDDPTDLGALTQAPTVVQTDEG